jgi:hypothetical protein
VILLTSTKSQAVRNAASHLGLGGGANARLLSQHWVVGLPPHLAVYDASREAAESASGMLLLRPLMAGIFAPT